MPKIPEDGAAKMPKKAVKPPPTELSTAVS